MVTGGSSGIYRAIAEAYARAGASVVIIVRTESGLAETFADLESAGGRAAWVQADLSTRDGVRRAASEVVEAFGESDIVINSAGINLRPPMNELDKAVWDTTMAVNLEACTMVGRNGLAADFAGQALFLASCASDYVTGHSLFVDGGLSVHYLRPGRAPADPRASRKR